MFNLNKNFSHSTENWSNKTHSYEFFFTHRIRGKESNLKSLFTQHFCLEQFASTFFSIM